MLWSRSSTRTLTEPQRLLSVGILRRWVAKALRRDQAEVKPSFPPQQDLLGPSRLVAIQGDYIQPMEHILDQEVSTMGRYGACDIVVNLNTVSRLHAKIERDGPRYFLFDADSANGTFINGELLNEPHLLRDEDQIGLGSPAPLLQFEDADPTFEMSGWLRYHPKERVFYLKKKRMELTPSEFNLLHLLYQHVGELCTRKRCSEAIWSRDFEPEVDDNALNRVVSNLRTKLQEIDPEVEYIETRRGQGYVLRL